MSDDLKGVYRNVNQHFTSFFPMIRYGFRMGVVTGRMELESTGETSDPSPHPSHLSQSRTILTEEEERAHWFTNCVNGVEGEASLP